LLQVFAWALVAAPAFASVISLRLWMCALAFSILQVPVTLAHVFVMLPSPAQTTTLFGKQLSPSKLWAALFPNVRFNCLALWFIQGTFSEHSGNN
jgi:hypothetical protein